MNELKEQKLVGYIIYDIWTCGVSHDRGETWQKQTIIPEVHWKNKIYLTEASANEAAKHIIGKDDLHRAVIIPIYANKDELKAVKYEWDHLKEIINEQSR
jgi:hypothetical protein